MKHFTQMATGYCAVRLLQLIGFVYCGFEAVKHTNYTMDEDGVNYYTSCYLMAFPMFLQFVSSYNVYRSLTKRQHLALAMRALVIFTIICLVMTLPSYLVVQGSDILASCQETCEGDCEETCEEDDDDYLARNADRPLSQTIALLIIAMLVANVVTCLMGLFLYWKMSTNIVIMRLMGTVPTFNIFTVHFRRTAPTVQQHGGVGIQNQRSYGHPVVAAPVQAYPSAPPSQFEQPIAYPPGPPTQFQQSQPQPYPPAPPPQFQQPQPYPPGPPAQFQQPSYPPGPPNKFQQSQYATDYGAPPPSYDQSMEKR